MLKLERRWIQVGDNTRRVNLLFEWILEAVAKLHERAFIDYFSGKRLVLLDKVS
jgi:hypothetical protein